MDNSRLKTVNICTFVVFLCDSMVELMFVFAIARLTLFTVGHILVTDSLLLPVCVQPRARAVSEREKPLASGLCTSSGLELSVSGKDGC